MHVDYGSTAYMACVAYIGTESQSNGVVTQMAWSDPHRRPLLNNTDSSVTISTTRTVQNGQVFLKSILKICNFTTDNFGQYSCRVTNIYGQNEMSWIVSIPRLPIAPVLLTSPTSLSTEVGRTIYMTCSAYGYPYPAIIWRQDGQVVQPGGVVTIDTRVKSYSGAFVSVSTIKICGVDADNIGSYTCTASIRDIGQVVSGAWRLDLQQGKLALLHGYIDRNSYMDCVHTQLHESAVNLSINSVPEVVSSPASRDVDYGQTEFMTCIAYVGRVSSGASQLAETTVSWWYSNNIQLTNSSDGSVTIYTDPSVRNGHMFMTSILKICNFTQSNVGQYSCRVTNTNGQGSASWNLTFPLDVTPPRFIVSPPTDQVFANYGRTIYLPCAAYGFPFPRITWSRYGEVIDPGNSMWNRFSIDTSVSDSSGAFVTQSVLKICGVGEEDVGNYTCTASTRDFGSITTDETFLNVNPGIYNLCGYVDGCN